MTLAPPSRMTLAQPSRMTLTQPSRMTLAPPGEARPDAERAASQRARQPDDAAAG
jgi:hypothetical protein